MSKEVILMEDVDGLGLTGDLVRVADGYARNFLLPRNLAAPVTEATRRRVEKRKIEAEARRSKLRDAAVAQAAKIQELKVRIPVKAGSEGKLFGSVTSLDIVAALKAQGVTVEKHQVEIPAPIKVLGETQVLVKLMPDVQAELKVEVVED